MRYLPASVLSRPHGREYLLTMLSSSPNLPAKQRIRQAFDQAATTYDEAADVQREVCDRLADYFEQVALSFKPDAILDAGCGTGYGIHWLEQRWPLAELNLVDFAPGMLLASRTRSPQALRVCADIEALPFADHSFDLIVSQYGIEYSDLARSAAEVAQIGRAHV